MTFRINDISITMLCHFDEGHYAECRILLIAMLNVIMLSVSILSVVMLSAFILSVAMLSVFILSVVCRSFGVKMPTIETSGIM